MATDRPRLQAYVEPELHERFVEWKQERGLSKDSEALNQLLAEYFGVSTQTPISNDQIEEINERINEYVNQQFNELNAFRVEFHQEVCLQLKKESAIWNEKLQKAVERLDNRVKAAEEMLDVKDGVPTLLQEALQTVQDQRYVIEDILSKLPSELSSASPLESPESLSELPRLSLTDDIEHFLLNHDESLSSQEVQAIVEDLSEYSEPPSELPSSPLTQSELAKRLGCHKSMVSRHKEGSNFEEWSRGKDPVGIAWRYDRKQQKFTPADAN